MANIETFKEFVKKNPQLLKYVKTGEMNWQKFYEIYDLYGEDTNAWQEYLTPSEPIKSTLRSSEKGIGLTDVLGWLKTMDLDSIQSGVGSIQRVVGLLQDFKTKDVAPAKETYKPRPMYKHFED